MTPFSQSAFTNSKPKITWNNAFSVNFFFFFFNSQIKSKSLGSHIPNPPLKLSSLTDICICSVCALVLLLKLLMCFGVTAQVCQIYDCQKLSVVERTMCKCLLTNTNFMFSYGHKVRNLQNFVQVYCAEQEHYWMLLEKQNSLWL